MEQLARIYEIILDRIAGPDHLGTLEAGYSGDQLPLHLLGQ